MKMTKNTIALRRNLIIVPRASRVDHGPVIASLVYTLQAELMNLGFMLSEKAMGKLMVSTPDFVKEYASEVIPALREQMGANRDYQPMYRNFPREVMEMTHLELFINAIIHYWSNGQWEPTSELKDRGFAFENIKFTILEAGTEEDLLSIFTRLVSMNTAPTPVDVQAVEWFAANYSRDQVNKAMPESVPFKETLCRLAAFGFDVPVKTPVDVLRIAAHMSGGDISLPGIPTTSVKTTSRYTYWLDSIRKARQEARETFKFRKFKRGERTYLLGLLEKTGANVADMARHAGRWLRLGEILHPGEYAVKFPKSNASFGALRNQKPKVRTFNAQVDLAFAESPDAGISLLMTRPGEFARRLDWMLRTFNSKDVLVAFESIGDKISNKVLFELYGHFLNRDRAGAPRMIHLKGRGSKTKVLEAHPPFSKSLVESVKTTILNIVCEGFKKQKPLGKVWIDEQLKNIPVPFAMRSSNTSVKTYVRGTRVPFNPEAKTIRAFVHWYDEQGSQDIDLSASLHDADMKAWTPKRARDHYGYYYGAGHISYTNLKVDSINACHSGDIRHRQGACAEYIDIDINSALEAGVRYVFVQVYNFNGRPLHSIKDCVFGLMEREKPESNKIFKPDTISNCAKISNEGTTVLVAILDLKERNYIWTDIEAERGIPNLENTRDQTGAVLKAMLNDKRMTVYDLVKLHAKARGTEVASPDAADTKFVYDDFVHDYDKAANLMVA